MSKLTSPHPQSTEAATTPRWVRNAGLARYLAVSGMCIWRWKRDASINFPQPVVVNNVEYNDLNLVDTWMRERIVDRTKTPRTESRAAAALTAARKVQVRRPRGPIQSQRKKCK